MSAELVVPESPFEVYPYYIVKHVDVLIKNIDFENSRARVVLEMKGRFLDKSKRLVRFCSILPVIIGVSIKNGDSDYINAEYEHIPIEEPIAVTEDPTQGMVSKQDLLRMILNREDYSGNGNLYVYIPQSVEISEDISFMFDYWFYYESKDKVSEMEEIYLPMFVTPSDHNFPSGGYKQCLWMPCLNGALNCSTWTINVKTPIEMMAVASGEWLDVCPTTHPEVKLWKFRTDILTNAGNIGVIVGKLQSLQLPETPVVGFSTLGKHHLLNDTLSCVPSFIKFFQEFFSLSLPYNNLKFVFLSKNGAKCQIFQNLVVISASCMCYATNVVRTYKNFKIFAKALADVIFGSHVLPRTIADLWLIVGMAKYLYYVFYRKYFGFCEFSRHLHNQHKHACKFPDSSNRHHFFLSPHAYFSYSSEPEESVSPQVAIRRWFSSSHPLLLCTRNVWMAYSARCGLAMFSIEKTISQGNLLQVISQIASIPEGTSARKFPSSEFLFSSILDISGKDILFQVRRNWLNISRPLFIHLEYSYNRRRSCVEVALVNKEYELEDNVPVNISLTVQEYDGAFEHMYQFNRDSARKTIEIPLNSSKTKRTNLKRRIIVEHGRDVDLEHIQSIGFHKILEGLMNGDSPILWVRVNVEQLTFFGKVYISQSDFSWHYQAYLESDPAAHLMAIKRLRHFPCDQSIIQLERLVKSKSCWFRVRCQAFDSLVYIFNTVNPESVMKADEHHPLLIYRSIFFMPNYQEIPKINDFSTSTNYFLHMGMVRSLALLKGFRIRETSLTRVRTGYDVLPNVYDSSEICTGKYESCCFTAACLDALGESLLALESDQLKEASNHVIEESLLNIKQEETAKFYHGCISSSCLTNVLRLQKIKQLPWSSKIFVHCCLPGVNDLLRHCALVVLAEYVQITQSIDEYVFMIDIIRNDPCLGIRRGCVYALMKHPPFQAKYHNTLVSPINNDSCYAYLYELIERVSAEQENFSFFIDLLLYYEMLYGEGHYRPLASESLPSANVDSEEGPLKLSFKINGIA